ncbi:MAG: diguanylate cyclase, partial [Sulfurimonadaceae bacterium]|nr:diguanylate cyclase [Sulfurimonadaceae bacterium]
PLSLLMIDIDHFKLYNDHYGHQGGDKCLKQVAELIENTMQRPADLAARYGGEEFACILPETSHEGAVLVAKTIQEHLSRLALEHAASPVSDRLTLSIGISTIIPSNNDTPAILVEEADQRLYRAKAEGRNRYISEAAT